MELQTFGSLATTGTRLQRNMQKHVQYNYLSIHLLALNGAVA